MFPFQVTVPIAMASVARAIALRLSHKIVSDKTALVSQDGIFDTDNKGFHQAFINFRVPGVVV